MHRRLFHQVILALHFPKNVILIFWHIPIKLDPLNPKIAFLFGFEAPGRRRSHLQITKLYFYLFWASPLATLACLGLHEARVQAEAEVFPGFKFGDDWGQQ